MRMKNSYLGVLASLLACSSPSNPFGGREEPRDEKKERVLAREKLLHKLRELKLKKGLTPFLYGDEEIWARDQENADRKARNKGLL